MDGCLPDSLLRVPDFMICVEERRRKFLLALIYYYRTSKPVPNPKLSNAVEVYLSKDDKHFREEFRVPRAVFDRILEDIRPVITLSKFGQWFMLHWSVPDCRFNRH